LRAFADLFQSPQGENLVFLDLRHNSVPFHDIVKIRKDLGKPMSDDPTEGPGWMLLFGERQLLLNR